MLVECAVLLVFNLVDIETLWDHKGSSSDCIHNPLARLEQFHNKLDSHETGS